MNKVKEQREKLNMSQKDVADQLGLKVPQYQRYESGKTKPNIIMARDIASVLHVKLARLVDWLEELY